MVNQLMKPNNTVLKTEPASPAATTNNKLTYDRLMNSRRRRSLLTGWGSLILAGLLLCMAPAGMKAQTTSYNAAVVGNGLLVISSSGSLSYCPGLSVSSITGVQSASGFCGELSFKLAPSSDTWKIFTVSGSTALLFDMTSGNVIECVLAVNVTTASVSASFKTLGKIVP